MKTITILSLAVLAAFAVAAFRAAPAAAATPAPKFHAGPEINGKIPAFSKEPLTLVSFWTFACSNCRYNLPIYAEWQKKYQSRGLKVVSVHTPELSFERDLGNVKSEVKKLGITYPVLVDADKQNWKAWGVQYWPTYFLVDSKGVIRAKGEGEIHDDKGAWEAKIDALLKEAGR